jgi:flagellar biosynthesis protein FlhF
VEQLRTRYGDSYLITNFRAVQADGFFNMLSRKTEVEVEYVVVSRKTASYTSPSSISTGMRATQDDFQQQRRQILQNAGKMPPQQMLDLASVIKKIEQLDSKFDTKLDDIKDGVQNAVGVAEMHPTIKKLEEKLYSNEFTMGYTKKMCERLRKELTLEQLDDEQGAEAAMIGWILDSVAIAKPVPFKKPVVIIIIGPTGVGKTTTMAKFATKYRRLEDNEGIALNINMVTIDMFRIAANVQVEKFAEILGAKFTTAQSAEDIRKIVELEGSHMDVLLIDTIGYSPNDLEKIAKMRKILDVSGLHPEMYLAVSASTKACDLETIMRNYEPFNYKSVIVTKYDETEHVGNIVSVLSEKGKPVSYFTTGQKVTYYHLEDATPLMLQQKLGDFKLGNGRTFDIEQEI